MDTAIVDYWRYLIIVLVALGVGLGSGLWLKHALDGQQRSRATKQIQRPGTSRADRQRKALLSTEADMDRINAQITRLTQAMGEARHHLDQHDQEHTRLLLILDERNEEIKAARQELAEMERLLADRKQETESTLSQLDSSLEELDLLDQLKETYLAKINRLTQQVQWQDSELRMLRQTIKARTLEIDEAQAILDQKDNELQRLNRQRQQREVDLVRARDLLARQEEEMRQRLSQAEAYRMAEASDTRGPAPRPVKGIAMLPAPAAQQEPGAGGRVIIAPANGPDDDLTLIPGLGELYARQLRAYGVRTFEQLAQTRPEDIERILHIPGHYSPDISGWIKAARHLKDEKSG